MHQIDLIGILIGGFAILLLPVILPLFFCAKVQRRTLFYLVGLACSYLCYKVATFVWAFFAVFLGSVLASLRHEDFHKGTEYSFALVAPGLKDGNMVLALLPILVLGTLLSVFVLRKLKTALFTSQNSASVN